MENIFSSGDEPADVGPDPELVATMKSGANWFYWIAGLSLVNSLILAFGGDVNFILGPAATQIVDALAIAFSEEGAFSALRAAAFAVNLLIAGLFVAFGYFGRKGVLTAFIVGIVIYVFDGLVYLYFEDMLAAGFHVFALIFIGKGVWAAVNLRPYVEQTN